MTEGDIVRFSGEGNPRMGLVYSGHVIHDRDEMLSLTDMWRAQGSDPARKPIEWLDSADGKRFCETAALILNPLKNIKVEESHFEENQLVSAKKGGNNAGTWAHWQIGLAYAKYLSPEFHMWCNSVVRTHMEGRTRQAPPVPTTAEAFSHAFRMIADAEGRQAEQQRAITLLEQKVDRVEKAQTVLPSRPANAEGITHIRDRIGRRFGLSARVIDEVMRQSPYAPKPAGMVRNDNVDADGALERFPDRLNREGFANRADSDSSSLPMEVGRDAESAFR